MIFISVVIIFLGLLGFILYRVSSLKNAVHNVSLVALIFSIIINIALAQNYSASLVLSTEGIFLSNIIAKLVIGESSWSINLFKNFYDVSTIISLGLLVIYSSMLIYSVYNKKNKNFQYY